MLISIQRMQWLWEKDKIWTERGVRTDMIGNALHVATSQLASNIALIYGPRRQPLLVSRSAATMLSAGTELGPAALT